MILHNVCSKKFIEFLWFYQYTTYLLVFYLSMYGRSSYGGTVKCCACFYFHWTGPDHFCDEVELGDFWIGK